MLIGILKWRCWASSVVVAVPCVGHAAVAIVALLVALEPVVLHVPVRRRPALYVVWCCHVRPITVRRCVDAIGPFVVVTPLVVGFVSPLMRLE